MSLLKEKIINVASVLFEQRGINSTGVDTIVAEAGTTKMTLYKYFKSKELLILEVLSRRQHHFQSWLSQQLDKNTHHPEEKLQRLFDTIEEWLNEKNTLGYGFLNASAEFPNEENPIHQFSVAQSAQFKEYIQKLATEANIQEAESLALQLSLLVDGAIQAEQMKRGSGAIKYAKKAAKILIDSAQLQKR
jgi:AcrR family transcriptional regulator